MTYIRVVSRDAAINPIARAVARQQLRRYLLDAKIALYLMTPTDEYQERLDGIVSTLEPMIMAACIEIAENFTDLGAPLRTMRAGRDVCVELLRAGAYDPSKAPVICNALDAAEEVNPKIKPHSMQKALYELSPKQPC